MLSDEERPLLPAVSIFTGNLLYSGLSSLSNLLVSVWNSDKSLRLKQKHRHCGIAGAGNGVHSRPSRQALKVEARGELEGRHFRIRDTGNIACRKENILGEDIM
jgi:hypothetical protein